MDRERLEVTKRIMKAVRHESARVRFREFNADGARQIVVCLETDTLQYLAERVSAVGGRAVAVVPHRDVLIPLGCVMGDGTTIDALDAPTLQLEHFHPQAEVGMLIEYIISNGAESFGIHLTTGLGEMDVRGAGEHLKMPA